MLLRGIDSLFQGDGLITDHQSIQVPALINADVMSDKHIFCYKAVVIDMNRRAIIMFMPLCVLETEWLPSFQQNDNLWLRV